MQILAACSLGALGAGQAPAATRQPHRAVYAALPSSILCHGTLQCGQTAASSSSTPTDLRGRRLRQQHWRRAGRQRAAVIARCVPLTCASAGNARSCPPAWRLGIPTRLPASTWPRLAQTAATLSPVLSSLQLAPSPTLPCIPEFKCVFHHLLPHLISCAASLLTAPGRHALLRPCRAGEGLKPGGTRERLPIFPLGIVALPAADVPLQIFEARYRVLFSTLMAGAPG